MIWRTLTCVKYKKHPQAKLFLHENHAQYYKDTFCRIQQKMQLQLQKHSWVLSLVVMGV